MCVDQHELKKIGSGTYLIMSVYLLDALKKRTQTAKKREMKHFVRWLRDTHKCSLFFVCKK